MYAMGLTTLSFESNKKNCSGASGSWVHRSLAQVVSNLIEVYLILAYKKEERQMNTYVA
jgi:hypothetical protein